MHSKMTSLFSLILLSSILFSCKKETNQSTQTESGVISGTVRLYDDKTNQLSDASGVSINVIGQAGKTTITGTDGRFRLEGLPFDNYDLSFSKTGYGTYKIFGIDHRKQPNTPSGTVSITQLPNVINLGAVSGSSVISLTALDYTYNEGPGIEYSYSIEPVPTTTNRGYTRTFLSKNHTISPSNYLGYSLTKSVLSNNTRGGFTNEELFAFGFNKGDSVYVKVYGDSFYSNDYTEPSTGKRVFPNLNSVSSAAVNFVIP
jgi:hypothetical protein